MDGGLTDSIRMAVQWLFVPLLAFAVLAWLCLKIESLGVFETIRSAVRRMSAFQRFAAAAFLAVFIVFASEKTNSPPANIPPPVLPPPLPPVAGSPNAGASAGTPGPAEPFAVPPEQHHDPSGFSWGQSPQVSRLPWGQSPQVSKNG